MNFENAQLARAAGVALAFLLSGPAAMAQADRAGQNAGTGSESADLEEIVVTALRTKKPANAIPQTVTLIEQEQLDAQLAIAPDMSSVLEKLVPGYAPSRQKMTSSGESFRGRKPLILIDGVPQSNPLRDGARSGFTIDPEVIQRIEVIHGSNAIQGLGATGGIINYVTKAADPSGDLSQILSFRTTAFDEFDSHGYGYRAHYSVSKKIDRFDYVASAAYEHRPIQYDGRGNTIGIETTSGDTADSDSYNFFGKFGYDIDGAQRLQFMINRFEIEQTEDWIASGGSRADGTPTIAIEGSFIGAPPITEVWTSSIGYTHDDFAGGSLSLVGYYQDFSAVFGGGNFGSFQDPAIAPIGELYDQTNIVSEKFGMRLTYLRDDLFSTGINTTAGLDYADDTTAQALKLTSRNRVPVIEYKGLTPFVQLDKQVLESLSLSGGFRYENAELVVPDFRSVAGATRRLDPSDPRYYTETAVVGGAPSFEELVHNFGAVYNVTDNLNAFGSFSQGFTMADVGRAIRDLNEPGIRIDDFLDIEPVVVDTTEFGFKYNGDPFSLKLSYYWSESKLGTNIVPNLDAEGSVRIERQRVEIEGFEIVSQWDVSDNLLVGGHFSHTEGKSDSDGDGRVDEKLDGLDISPDKLGLYMDYRLSDTLRTRLQSTTFFDADYSETNTRADFEGYTIIDLTVDYDTEIGRFNLAIENLTDEYYLSLFSQTFAADGQQFAGRGRMLSLGYLVEF